MSVCPYYLRGNCRYGNRCRFSHENSNAPRVHYPNVDTSFRPRHPRPQINPNCRYVAPAVANRNHNVQNTNVFGRQNRRYADVEIWVYESFENRTKALDILGQLQKEARVWQKSDHFWRFTSRSLFPGGQPLEDWHDQSFEEVRWAYQCMKGQNQEHVYKKTYYDYITKTERHLNGLSALRIDILRSLKDYIQQYVVSNYEPSKTLPTDIEMKDVNGDTTSNVLPSIASTNYTPDDLLLEDERAAYESDTFEFGQIPVHAPSKQFC